MPVPLISIRNQILLNIRDTYRAIVADAATPITVGNPDGAPIGIQWTTVELGALDLKDTRKHHSMGIVPGEERKRAAYPLWYCDLAVNIEFRTSHNQGDLSSQELGEAALTAVQRVMFANKVWGGLAYDTTEIGNEIDLTSYAHRAIMGVLKLVVQYRHSEFDPRSGAAV